MGPHNPAACKTQTETATTTTTFKIVLMLDAMGMKRLIKYNPMPTTIKAITIFIKGILAFLVHLIAIHNPMLPGNA
jgi:hypothetical protein